MHVIQYFPAVAYNKHMNFLRRIGLALSASIFSIAIFLFATMLSLFLVFGTPAHIENALSQSGIYNDVGQFLLEKNQDKGDGTLPLTNPTVKSAVTSAIPASTVERNVDHALDSTYAWAQGKTASPNFTIDLTEIKGAISANLSDSLTAKLQALPVCPAGTVIPTSTAAILSLTCRPANVPVGKMVQAVEQQAEGKGIISDNSLNSQSIKNSDGQPIFEQLHNVPKLYQNYVRTLYILPVLAVITALGVFFLSRSKRAGIRRVGVTLVTTGIYATIFALLALWLMNHYAGKLSEQATALASLQGKLIGVIRILADDLRHNWLIFGIAYLVVGGVIWLLSHLIRRQKKHEAISNPLSHNMNIPAAGTMFTPKDEADIAADTAPVPSAPPLPGSNDSEAATVVGHTKNTHEKPADENDPATKTKKDLE